MRIVFLVLLGSLLAPAASQAAQNKPYCDELIARIRSAPAASAQASPLVDTFLGVPKQLETLLAKTEVSSERRLLRSALDKVTLIMRMDSQRAFSEEMLSAAKDVMDASESHRSDRDRFYRYWAVASAMESLVLDRNLPSMTGVLNEFSSAMADVARDRLAQDRESCRHRNNIVEKEFFGTAQAGLNGRAPRNPLVGGAL